MRRYNISILSNLKNPPRIELVQIFSPGANAVNEVRIFEYSEMLRDCLPSETRAFGEPRD